MRIAILGCTSQIAKDLTLAMGAAGEHDLLLYGRSLQVSSRWIEENNLTGRCHAYGYDDYDAIAHDAVINFVGVGDPARAAEMAGEIFEITLKYDQLILDGLKKNPQRRYLFLSSGAAYGPNFQVPADAATLSTVSINAVTPQQYYSVAKLHAESRHRALGQQAIVDLRVFNMFSRTQDLSARFLVTDIMRSLLSGEPLPTSPEPIVRDFMHPSDFHQMVECVLRSPCANVALDCYSRAPVEKFELLEAMKKTFGLKYFVEEDKAIVNATGTKPYYYSKNYRAMDFGYEPKFSSLETVLTEAFAILGSRGSIKGLGGIE